MFPDRQMANLLSLRHHNHDIIIRAIVDVDMPVHLGIKL